MYSQVHDECLTNEQYECAQSFINYNVKKIYYVRRELNEKGQEVGSFHIEIAGEYVQVSWLVARILSLQIERRQLAGSKSSSRCFQGLVTLPHGSETAIRDLSEILYGDWRTIEVARIE
jgi:hypothetical protein